MGEFILITGPMKSGKTKRLIEEYEKFKQNYKCILLKPDIDTRFSPNEVVSRYGTRLPATVIKTAGDILNYTGDYDVFFFDELQFIKGAERAIRHLIELDKIIVASALTLTSEKNPFLQMGNIMCYVDTLITLKGKCDNCGQEDIGKYTFYKGKKDKAILVGDTEYLCVCPKCYKELSLEVI